MEVLQERQLSMTEGAAACGMPLTTLSSLAHGDSRASMKTVRLLSAGLECRPGRLFPELRGNDEPAEVPA